MVQKVLVEKIDDTDGTPATTTVAFGLDGAGYEIDLSSANATALRAALAPFLHVARRLPRGGQVARDGGRPTTWQSAESLIDPAAVRAWAASNGSAIPARRRIPAELIARYRAAGY